MCNQMIKQMNKVQFQAFRRIMVKGNFVVPSCKNIQSDI